MQKRRERKRAGAVKISCLVAAVIFMVSACALDSLTWVPFVLCCLSISWLTLVGIANDPYRKKGIREFADSADANKK